MLELATLCCVAFLAGLLDSVVGGGGLIQTPALFVFLPPHWAASVPTVFGTNKMSSICGTGTAVVQFARRIRIPWASILPAALAAFVFAFFGARTVSRIDADTLKPIIFTLLVAVSIYTWWNNDLGAIHAPKLKPAHEKLAATLTGAIIGFYDGFFGPGTGSFLIFAFIGLLGFDFLSASASAKVVNFATNLAALAWFAPHQQVLYQYGLPMGACNVAGALLGTRLALLKGNQFVRSLFLLVATAMIARFGWDVFAP